MDARRKLWTEYDAVTQLTTGIELNEVSMATLLAEHPDAVVDVTSYESDRVTLADGTFYVNHWFVY